MIFNNKIQKKSSKIFAAGLLCLTYSTAGYGMDREDEEAETETVGCYTVTFNGEEYTPEDPAAPNRLWNSDRSDYIDLQREPFEVEDSPHLTITVNGDEFRAIPTLESPPKTIRLWNEDRSASICLSLLPPISGDLTDLQTHQDALAEKLASSPTFAAAPEEEGAEDEEKELAKAMEQMQGQGLFRDLASAMSSKALVPQVRILGPNVPEELRHPAHGFLREVYAEESKALEEDIAAEEASSSQPE